MYARSACNGLLCFVFSLFKLLLLSLHKIQVNEGHAIIMLPELLLQRFCSACWTDWLKFVSKNRSAPSVIMQRRWKCVCFFVCLLHKMGDGGGVGVGGGRG